MKELINAANIDITKEPFLKQFHGCVYAYLCRSSFCVVESSGQLLQDIARDFIQRCSYSVGGAEANVVTQYFWTMQDPNIGDLLA